MPRETLPYMIVEELRQMTGPIGFRTIVETVIDAIAARKLVPGQRLPPQRHLAQDIGVAVATVGRAYSALETQGFITSHVGRGTFISLHPRREKEPPSASAGPIELGVYRAPVPQVRPGLAALLATVAATPNIESILDSAPTPGLARHREIISQWIGRSQIDADPDDIVLTNGGQHAVMAALSGLTESGARIATEELTDPRMKAVASFLGRNLVGVACDQDGMLPDDLDRLCRAAKISALYCTPRHHNPTNVTMPLKRRADLVEVARRHNLTIIESDIYGSIAEDHVTALCQFAPERTYRVSSLARIAGAGMKVGWLIAPPGNAKNAHIGVAMSTGVASPFMAELATRMIVDGKMEEMLRWQQVENRHRLSQLRGFPILSGARGEPTSAHVWLNLPEPWRAEDLVEAAAREHNINIAPSHTFVVGRRTVPHAIRLVIGAPLDQDELLLACERLERLLSIGPRPSTIAG